MSLPFLLPFRYLIYSEDVDGELVYPPGLKEKLLSQGLIPTELSDGELLSVADYTERNRRLTVEDCAALAIAKHRNIILITGDRALRMMAEKEGVRVIGSIGVLDLLYEKRCIPTSAYRNCLEKFEDMTGKGRRLPLEEIRKRISALQ